MKKLSIVVMALFAMLLCAPTMAQTDVDDINKKIQAARDQQELMVAQGKMPCMDAAMEDAEYYRAIGVGTHRNIGSAMRAALKDAKQNVRLSMKEFVQSTLSDWDEVNRGNSEEDEINSLMENKMLSVIEGHLNAAETICRFQGRTDKNIPQVYIAIQISKKEIKQEIINEIQSDLSLQNHFKADQFSKIMDERMEEIKDAKENAGY